MSGAMPAGLKRFCYAKLGNNLECGMASGGLFFCGKCFFAVVGGAAKMGGVVGGEVVAAGTVGARAHVDVVMGGGV